MMRVKFVECATIEQIHWRGDDDPNSVLKIGETYEVSVWDESAWHTHVQLKGIDGRFNYVSFEVVEE